MSFIDEITIHARAGRGGDGVVLWRHERAKEFAGAAGGNGGRGGDVYIRAVRDLSILNRYRNSKEFEGGNGTDGMRNSMHGKDGDDITIDLPIGSIVKDMRNGRLVSLLSDGQLIKILKGGRGGLGNEHFKASTNVTPLQSTPGKEGEESDFHIELELVADGGLIGLPNAGKSSLLNALTNADAKVGSYQFTTLEPNLGALPGGFILADIPGLIEGASEGRGLGIKFLRHVKRTRMLFHLISLEGVVDITKKADKVSKFDADSVAEVYETIREELKKYSDAQAKIAEESIDGVLDEQASNLDQKPETIIFTKTDVFGTDKKVIAAGLAAAKKSIMKVANAGKKPANKIKESDILSVTILDDVSVKVLMDEIVKRLRA
ncbi:MAG: Obg family GTPase CgtA [Candidatus Taylorbacteria bacterium]|nr:Obg family GTPase CgtA [Candidatus Taylorbacteria bacterium]